MSIGTTLDSLEAVRDPGVSVVVKLLKSWTNLCEDYLKRERRDVIEREPDDAKLAELRQELKWLLRSGRNLLSLATDPDYPAPRSGDEIAWRMRQLEDSWRSLNNPIDEAEAQVLLKTHFSDDPLAAKLSPG